MVSLVFLGDHNFEIRIGSKDWVGQSHAGVRWGWEWGLQKALPPSPMPGTSDPVCPGLPLWPATPPPVYVSLHAFIFPLIPLCGSGSGHSCHHVWLASLDVCWALFMDCLSYGRCHRYAQGIGRMGWYQGAHARLFVFLPPLVGWS
jgi:hypothetical protein